MKILKKIVKIVVIFFVIVIVLGFASRKRAVYKDVADPIAVSLLMQNSNAFDTIQDCQYFKDNYFITESGTILNFTDEEIIDAGRCAIAITSYIQTYVDENVNKSNSGFIDDTYKQVYLGVAGYQLFSGTQQKMIYDGLNTVKYAKGIDATKLYKLSYLLVAIEKAGQKRFKESNTSCFTFKEDRINLRCDSQVLGYYFSTHGAYVGIPTRKYLLNDY